MKLGHLFKELRYYTLLDGSPKRVIYKFLFSKTPLSKITNTKLYNFFYQKRMMKFTKKYSPSILQIENTNLCNARCIMCPHTIMKRKGKIMNFEDFKKIVDTIIGEYPSITHLTITGFGECLIDPGLIKKIGYINEKYPKMKIDIFSNASLLTKELSDQLLTKKIRRINFSINSTRKSYKKITGLDYDQVKKNITYFVKHKKSTYPLINFSLMVLKENEKEIKPFIQEWAPLGDSVMTYLPLDWTGDTEIKTINPTSIKKKRWACIPLWQNITVDANGDVIMCCQDYESKVKFGNVLKDPIKGISEGRALSKIREMHRKGDYSMALCNKCDNWLNSSFWWGVYN